MEVSRKQDTQPPEGSAQDTTFYQSYFWNSSLLNRLVNSFLVVFLAALFAQDIL